MIERQKRLKEVYDYLRLYFGIHTQKDFANMLRKSRNSVTLALNGNESYLTDKLFENICSAFPGIFNLDYLLNGIGELTISKKNNGNDEATPDDTQPREIDMSSVINSIIAAKDQVIEEKERTITAKDKLIEEKDNAIARLQAHISRLESFLSQKDDYIDLLLTASRHPAKDTPTPYRLPRNESVHDDRQQEK